MADIIAYVIEADPANLIAAGALVVAIVSWISSHKTARRAEDIARQALHVAHRPHVSIDIFEIEETSFSALNFASVFENHGKLPASIISAYSEVRNLDGKVIARPEPLRDPLGRWHTPAPTDLCIFPRRTAELRWTARRTSPEWSEVINSAIVFVKITYRGALKGAMYTTEVEATHKIRDRIMERRATQPMPVRRMEAT